MIHVHVAIIIILSYIICGSKNLCGVFVHHLGNIFLVVSPPHTKKTRLPQPCVCTTRLFPGCHNLVVTALQPGVPLTRLSQPCGDSLATWCSSYKVVTTLWGQPCNLVFLLQGCHNLVVTTYSRPEKLGWEVRLL